MAFTFKNSKGNEYYLHTRTTVLKSGKKQQIFFFSRSQDGDEVLNKVPEGYEAIETSTGLPVLRKSANQ
ncbi:MAG: hypothetical protein GYA17_14835 [Chloroflexi bacterium]|jgi:hypothetical protein|nr:hypothetical protein [Anaerolineaceae bacterium]NMB89632.1 hypothetical protein [Chloroflexota bacterium]